MPRKYNPAVFQPNIRPSWFAALINISGEEAKEILLAITKFPNYKGPETIVWKDLIEPDLQMQYEKFITICQERGRGARDYWGKHKENISIPKDKLKYNLLNVKDNIKDNVKDNINSKDNVNVKNNIQVNNNNNTEHIDNIEHIDIDYNGDIPF